MKTLNFLWIGIRPSGLGLRLISLQLQPDPLALSGERWPFIALPFGTRFDWGVAASLAVDFVVVRAAGFRVLIGLRLLGLALLSSALTSSSSSISSLIAVCAAALCFFLADLVIGPKYPSCDSRVSEGVGEGLMTLGVAGMGFEEFRDIVKGGKSGARITPVKSPTISGTLRSQKLVEWRCLSFREARVVNGKE